MFAPRLTKPNAGNKYYITKAKGGYSNAIVGNPTDKDCNVLSSAIGYAYGRFNEILGDTSMSYLSPIDINNLYIIAHSQGLKINSYPDLGAVMLWEGGDIFDLSKEIGHVAVVEQINPDGSIITSESGYGSEDYFWIAKRNKGDGNWGEKRYNFAGFIHLPK